MATFAIVLKGSFVYEAATIGLIALWCLSVLKRPKNCFSSINNRL